METIGSDIFEMRHIIVDEKGKLLVDKAAVQAGKNPTKPIAEYQLQQIPGSKVTCMTQNPERHEDVVIGSKDTLL